MRTEEELLGTTIRELRLGRGLTLTETARQAGISKSLLSQVEHGSTSASVAVLRSIANVLGVPFFRFFVSHDPTSNVVRKDARLQIDVPGSPVERQLLVPDLNRRLVVLRAVLAEGDISSPVSPSSHDGDEWVYVLTGRIEIEINGQTIILDEGDAYYFNAIEPHVMRNIHPGQSEVIAAISGRE